MPRHFDLDALRAARAEAQGEPPTVTLHGDTYVLPVEMPWSVVEALATDGAKEFLRAVKDLLGEDGYERALGTGATREDFGALVMMAAGELYEAGDPEASGSSVSSSSNGSSPSKPTSGGTTESTSEEPSGDPSESVPADSPA